MSTLAILSDDTPRLFNVSSTLVFADLVVISVALVSLYVIVSVVPFAEIFLTVPA